MGESKTVSSSCASGADDLDALSARLLERLRAWAQQGQPPAELDRIAREEAALIHASGVRLAGDALEFQTTCLVHAGQLNRLLDERTAGQADGVWMAGCRILEQMREHQERIDDDNTDPEVLSTLVHELEGMSIALRAAAPEVYAQWREAGGGGVMPG